MIYNSSNNWYSWIYNGQKYSRSITYDEFFLKKKYNSLPFRRHCDRTYDQLLSDLCQNLVTDPSCLDK